jgi:hypothetical protein
LELLSANPDMSPSDIEAAMQENGFSNVQVHTQNVEGILFSFLDFISLKSKHRKLIQDY